MSSAAKRKREQPPPPPPLSATPPPPPPETPPPPADRESEPEAPCIQEALDGVADAKAHAKEAAEIAATSVTLPATPAHNTLGEQLRDTLYPYAPARELLIPVRIDVDGSHLVPPVAQSFSDEVLWNVHEASVTPEAFAKLTCAEVGLAADIFEQPIAAQIRRAISATFASRKPADAVPAVAAAAAAAAAAAPPDAVADGLANGQQSTGGDSVVALELHVSHASGIELRDRVLWDMNDALTPEAFARQLCTDLCLPELEGAVAFAVREQLVHAKAVSSDLNPLASGSMRGFVRSECEAVEWGPQISAVAPQSACSMTAPDAEEAVAPPAQDSTDAQVTESKDPKSVAPPQV